MKYKKFVSLVLVLVMSLVVLANGLFVQAEEVREDLIICMPEDLETLDPVGTSAMATQFVHRVLYVRLYNEDTDGQPVPWLLKNFEAVSDTEIDIEIHDNATFSDGSPLTAEDVVASLDRCLASPIFNTLMKSVEGFEVVDDYNFKILTTGPSPSVRLALMHPGTGILPKAFLEEVEETKDWSSPVTSGPYRFDKREIGDYVTIVKVDDFFDEETSAKNNSLTFKFVPEASSRTIMVETGEADVNFRFATADYQRASENEDLKIHEHVGVIVQYIGFDTTQEPFTDKLVRQAVCYAINREDVMTVVAEGLGTIAYSVLPPSTLGHVENPAGYEYNPEKAKELLAEAGYENGFDTTLVAFNDLGKRVAEIVQMFLAEVGINAEIETYDSSVRLSMLANHQCPMLAGQWGAMSDADLVLPRLFTEEAIGGMNFTFFTDPRLDDLFEKARSTYDEEERVKYYNECVEILAEEAPWCPLYIPSSLALTRADLQGVELGGETLLNIYKLHYE